MTTVAIIGASSGIAQAAARIWAERGVDLRLVGRDATKLQRSVDDLTVRGARSVEVHTADIADADSVDEVTRWVFADRPVDTVLVAFGTMPSQDEADADERVAESLLHVNGTLTLLTAHAVTTRLLTQGSGDLVVIGSVAGDRGRQSNYLYGAAKAMVATGVAGLQHRTAASLVNVTLVKPGPTATPMTDHLRGGKLALASADSVARDIVAGADRGLPVVYTPAKWRLIMTIIRLLPRRVFHRTKL